MSRPRPLVASLEKPFDLNSLPTFQLISCPPRFLVQQNQTYSYTFLKIISSQQPQPIHLQQPSGAQSCTACHLPPQHTFPSKLNKMTWTLLPVCLRKQSRSHLSFDCPNVEHFPSKRFHFPPSLYLAVQLPTYCSSKSILPKIKGAILTLAHHGTRPSPQLHWTFFGIWHYFPGPPVLKDSNLGHDPSSQIQAMRPKLLLQSTL